MLTKDYVQSLFENLATQNSDVFFNQVSDKVNWTVMGTHPLAGIYQSKQAFLSATFQRLNKILNEGVVLKVNHVYVDGMTAVVEMQSLSTAHNGKPFNNIYCWVVEFNNDNIITKVRAYVDSALVQQVIDENEDLPQSCVM